MQQLLLAFACFLVILLLVHSDDNLETTECSDKLVNCPELVAHGICNNELEENAADCALTCNLCNQFNVVNHQARVNPRAVHVNAARVHSSARAPVRTAQHARPSASRAHAAARRPVHQQAHHPARQPARARAHRAPARSRNARTRARNGRRPAHRNSRQNVKSHARRAAGRKPQPHMGAGTVNENGSVKPVGPNLIRLPKDARPISELNQSKNKMNKLNNKLAEIKRKTAKVHKVMGETVDSIDNEDKAAKPAPKSKIQMLTSMFFPVQAKWSAKVVKKWVGQAKEIATDVEALVKDFDETKKEMDEVMETIKKQQENFKDRTNIAKSMEGFTNDFGKSRDNVKDIQAILVPTSDGLSAIINTVDSAKDDDELKELEQKFRDAVKAFEKIDAKIKETVDRLNQIFDNFESIVESIIKGKGDFKKPRTSGDGGDDKKDDGKKSGDDKKDDGKKGDDKKDEGKEDGGKEDDETKEPPKFTFACDGSKFIAGIAAGLDKGLECAATEDKAEQFEMVELGGKNVALKASNKKFCSHAEIGKPLKCDKEKSDGKTEQFEKVEGDSGVFSFKCLGDGNKFLTFDAADGLVCKTNGAGTPTAKEKFTSKKIEPKGGDGKTPAKDNKKNEYILLCKSDGKAIVGAAAGFECKETEDKGEKFTIVDLDSKKVTIQGPDGKFCSVKDTEKPIKCTEANGDADTEQFEKIKNDDGTFSFKCIGNKNNYLTVMSYGIKCVTESYRTPSDGEKFTLKEAGSASA